MATPAALVRQLLVVLLLATLVVTLAPAPPAEALTSATIRDRIYERINTARRNNGVRPLRVNKTVQYWAQRHARDMASAGTIYHDAALGTEVNRVTTSVWAYGENVGVTWDGRYAPRRIHRLFMTSSGHRANVLRSRFTHMGLGVVKRNGRIYVVERFADLTR